MFFASILIQFVCLFFCGDRTAFVFKQDYANRARQAEMGKQEIAKMNEMREE